ncbi:DUF1361 domain-containing protein [Fluviicola chungangensis]|uniref:DUF1361 domain-containing protein n=1 Tax=Fluviicola chungangensis TaxID=2597671 RepID=A0A556MR44_9FLAO|nr:DUF1361 domain-containing protein [Fluviicola chungangensis]TSJ42406.1 DUF1361 domain-containing protein [Fluviicola chungangensis]
MYKQLIKINQFQISLFMGVLSLFCFALSLFRVEFSGTKHFLFLNWNLFLAFIPWFLTMLLSMSPNLQKSRLAVFGMLGIWLLFFPNASYILTDLFHLSHHSSMPIWFDLVLILSFAWTGLLYGFLSLWNLEELMEQFLSKKVITTLSVFLLFVSGFGIYIGRYLRWNSWDILHQPVRLMGDVGDRIINPFDHTRTWGVTIFMGLFLTMIYFTFRFLKRNRFN